MRTAIYGAGAMGTVLGAYISKKGEKIDLITRNESHVAALKREGAHISGSVDFTAPVTALTPAEMSGRYDIIFLMTKQRKNAEICEFLSKYLADDGVICTTQNGLPELSVASVIGRERTLGCAISWGANFVKAGQAELTSDSGSLTFALGAYGEVASEKVTEVKRLLECMGTVTVEENFFGARWAKLAINSAFSSLSAVTGLTFGEVASGKTTKLVALGLLNEAFSVAKACGVKIEKIQGHDIVKIYQCTGGVKKFIALKLLPLAMKKHKNLLSGMYHDLKSGKQCDIDFINGVIVHSAMKFGVSVPLNLKVLEIAHAIERGERKISVENMRLFAQ